MGSEVTEHSKLMYRIIFYHHFGKQWALSCNAEHSYNL